MTPRRTALIFFGLALACATAGVAVLRLLPAARRAETAAVARSERAAAAFLQDMRRHSAPDVVNEPAPEPPAPDAEASVAIAPQAEAPADLQATPLDGDAPLPPPRPADLAELAQQTPTPPRRPNDLELLAEAASVPEPQPAPQAAAAPPPPAAAPEPAPQPQQPATPPKEVARANEPVLRPAPDDAFTQEPAPARFRMGQPAFVRIFKQEGQLELWLKQNGRFTLYKTYPVCKWSGQLGPKQREADYQSPEGFYSVSTKQLNPRSNYHLAFNVGYPNAYDRQHGRTGGLVMVHGNCKSVGCFAMTDAGIDEIYGFVAAALSGGQREVPVHIFPFRMSETAIAKHTGAGGGWLAFVGGAAAAPQWGDFWRNLKEGYDLFESTGEPPAAFACNGRYSFGAAGAACKRIAGW